MEVSSDLYDVHEANDPPSWEHHQPHCLEDVEKVERLQRKIKYYFMNPCEKFHARGRKPWKLILQIIKMAIITIQVHSNLTHDLKQLRSHFFYIVIYCPYKAGLFLLLQLVLFGLSNQMVVTFKEENLMTFKHLFLKNYADGGMDTYTVYRQADVYDHIEYIIQQVTKSYEKKL